MVQLETVEDFEKVRKALDNPDSSTNEYCVKTFGFCCFCDQITQYSVQDDGTCFCYKCEKTLKFCHYMEYIKNNPLYIINLPEQSDTGGKIKWLNSCVRQREFFKEALGEFIKKEKAKERQARNNVRRLAKLRFSSVDY